MADPEPPIRIAPAQEQATATASRLTAGPTAPIIRTFVFMILSDAWATNVCCSCAMKRSEFTQVFQP